MRRIKSHIAMGLTSLIIPSLISCNQANNSKKDNKQPNILVIIADDLGWNDVGYHGSEIKTPTIDKLAGEGIEFNHFYVCSVSSPTRASLLTGRYPSRYKILSPLADKAGLPAGTITLATLLNKNGYDTGISGKWHLGTVAEARPLNYGFNSSYGYLRGQIDPYTHLYKDGNRTWHRNDILTDEEGHATDLITEEAVRFLSKPRDKDKPFFLYVAYSVPHYPLDEPEEWINMYDQTIENESRRKYAAAVTHMDNAIAKILENLKHKELENNTMVIFLSDNGGQKSWYSPTQYNGKFEANDVLGDNRPLKDWKTSLYEGALRVPAVMIWPGKLDHMKIEDPIYVADIFPTLANIAGISIKDELNIDGINFWPAINGGSFIEERSIYWKLNNGLALKKGDWKLIHKGNKLKEGKNELYNIKADPYETNDLSLEQKDKVIELTKALKHQLSMDKKLPSASISK
jgi:arylsulfatase B